MKSALKDAVMRYPGEWMQKADDRILEILDEEGPRGVGYITDHKAVHASNATVSRRLSDLADHGLVSPRGNGVYMITEKGRAYLNEQYDADAEEYINASGGDTNGAGYGNQIES